MSLPFEKVLKNVGINDTLEIKKAKSKEAKSITFATTEPLRIVGAEEYLGEYLNGQLMTKGDTIPISVMGQRIDLVVISTNPSGPVIISDSTKITVSEESALADMKKVRPLSTRELKMYERISEEFGRPEIGTRRRGSSDTGISPASSSSAIT